MTTQDALSKEEFNTARDSLRRLLDRRDSMPGLWPKIAGLGFASLGLTEASSEIALATMAMAEMAGADCSASLFSAVLANFALSPLSARITAARQLIDLITEGQANIGIAFGVLDPDPNAGTIQISSDRTTVSGVLEGVEGHRYSNHFLAFGLDDRNQAFVATFLAAENGVSWTESSILGRPSFRKLDLAQVPATFFAIEPAHVEQVIALGRLLLAARAQGCVARGLEIAIDYSKSRQQFGQPIGQFQALQQKLADTFIMQSGTKLAAAAAARTFDSAHPDWLRQATVAFAFASEHLRRSLIDLHHVMGAVGISEDHEMPRLFRQVHLDLLRLGGPHAARVSLGGTALAGLVATKTGGGADATATASFRARVRRWLAYYWTADHKAASHAKPGPRYWDEQFSLALGAANFIGLCWTAQADGRCLDALQYLAFLEELEYADAPYAAHLLGDTIVAPAIIQHGTEAQKRLWLPQIRSGEMTFALGYSETEAGSDLASLRMQARRDGDQWVINGRKLWSSDADKAGYHWLAARTSPNAKPRHFGISVFVVRLDSEGITVRPGAGLHGKSFCEVLYEDVRVPMDALLGEENKGWTIVIDALAAERLMIGSNVAKISKVFGGFVALMRDPAGPGLPAARNALLADSIGALSAEIEVARQFVLHTISISETGRVPVVEGAIAKVFVSELMQKVAETILDFVGVAGLDSAGAMVVFDDLLRFSFMATIGGGTNEIQRSIIAQRGLGLPR